MLNNAGGAWDNAKKYIVRGNYGGKKSECHKASVVGDTVGDPFKDTSVPALNILIKLMSMVSVVLAGLTVAWSLFDNLKNLFPVEKLLCRPLGNRVQDSLLLYALYYLQVPIPLSNIV